VLCDGVVSSRRAKAEEESEEDRVRLDDEARARMADHVQRVQQAA
jgi:hypothetical protein